MMSCTAALAVRVTEEVASFLQEAASCSGVPETARADARNYGGSDTIAWDHLKSLVEEYRKANPGKAIYLHKICSKKDIMLPVPPAKEKSAELKARLARLQEELDNKRYSDMVADITQEERKANEMRDALLPTSRLQLSFGAHVLVTMFTFWAVAYYGSKMYFYYDELWAGLAGVVGLTAGLLLESLLLIVRSNRPVPLEERMPDLFDKAKVQEAFSKVRQMRQAEAEAKKAEAKKRRGGAAKQQQQQQQHEQQASRLESKKSR